MLILKVIPSLFRSSAAINSKFRNFNCHRNKHMGSGGIVWMDLEMTGLEVDKHKILEVSCLITDKNLNICAEAPTQRIYQPDIVLNSMNDWCKEHFKENGLLDACRKSSINIEEAEETLLKFLKQNVPEKICPLAGNTIYMDRFFLMKYMPQLNEYLHYRIIDVSSIKEICKRWNSSVFSKAPKKTLAHRSLDDIKETIEEFRYYRDNFFILK